MTAVTFVAEIGDIRRFENPRQLMSYLGLVPSENSTGERTRRGGITKAGNSRARRVLIGGACETIEGSLARRAWDHRATTLYPVD